MTEQSQAQFIHRPTRAEIHLDRIRSNLRAIKDYVGKAKVLAVVKANGYGHGMQLVTKAIEAEGIDFLGVAYIEEAIELRQAGSTVPILVFGGLLKDQLDLYIHYDVDVTASSVSKLEHIDATAQRIGKRARVHLKIDTGLERIGVHYYSAQTLFDAALRAKHCDIIGVYSHFADVDPNDLSLARLQLERFLEGLAYFSPRAAGPFVRHIAASGGVLAFPESHLDMVRPGLSLYGVYPHPAMKGMLGLRPTLTLKSQVVFFKVVKKGAGVSYGHRWHAPEDSRLITIPIGYGDGYSRQLSNVASVLVRGKQYPVVGAVCMDQLMANLGSSGEAYNGDEVVLIGEQGGLSISVEDVATAAGLSPYEVLVSLNQRIPRIPVR